MIIYCKTLTKKIDLTSSTEKQIQNFIVLTYAGLQKHQVLGLDLVLALIPR